MIILRRLRRFFLHVFILFTLLFVIGEQPFSTNAQTSTNETDLVVETIFNSLTPAERVGQLFIVSFDGANLSPNSNIAQLIQTYRVGGIVISAENRNFTNRGNTPSRILNLNNRLQNLALQPPLTQTLAITSASPLTPTVSATPVVTNTPTSYTPIPLFIAIQHEGDGYPNTQIRNGLTNIPSQMAIGATWDPENARMVGEIVGRELSLLGVNMLFGPSLDVLDNPRSDLSGSLGVRTFGGHPFWVEQMGEAYIRGIQQGSNEQLLTIATHFPGFGSSDREIDQALPAIAKSLDDLRLTELPPFFAITHLNPNDPNDRAGITDGLMTANIRYRGLPGNVPISLDARNLPAILALEEFVPWREAGGLIVSAPLGVPATLEGIVSNQESFPARRLAQDAFLAGSDLLLVTDFSFEDDSEAELANIINAIEFFQEKYADDPGFQAGVDRAVKNIIRAKIKIYGADLLEAEVLSPETNLELLDQGASDLASIAQAGVSLITPLTQEGVATLTEPPQPDENILIVTDNRIVRDCSVCPRFNLITTNNLEEIILDLFGPEATGQISAEQINSISFGDLKTALTFEIPSEPQVEEDETVAEDGNTEDEENQAETASDEEASTTEELPNQAIITNDLITSADWIIFAMLDIDPETAPQSDAVRLLLRNRYDTIRNKNLVLFAFNAPYFLDETEVGQLTAFYSFYSKTPAHLEAAARLLFQQFEPSGASPVTIPAIGPLDLSPDPNQSIQLEPIVWVDSNGVTRSVGEEDENPIMTFDLEVGEELIFRTSVIVDRNGQPVPDGTLVNFSRFYPLENSFQSFLEAKTVNGVAEILIVKEKDSPLLVSALSGLVVEGIPFNIGPGIVDTPTPTVTPTASPTGTPVPTNTPTPTATFTPTPTDTPTPVPTATPFIGGEPTMPARPVNYVDLAYSALAALLIGAIAFTLGGDRFSLEERIRPALVAMAFGLIGYISFTIAALTFPDSPYLAELVIRNTIGHWVAPLITLLFAIAGMIAWYLKPGRIFWVKRN